MSNEETIYSNEAESAVIGAVIINPDAFTELEAILAPDDFYIRRNREIWQAARDLHEAGQPVDYVTLSEKLNSRGKLAEIGGSAYLLSLINRTPTTMHATAYGRIVHDKARRRKILQIANTLATAAWNEAQDLDEVTPTVIEQLAGTSNSGQAARPISEYVSQLYDEVGARAENPVEVWGIPTGMDKYDRMTGGLQQGELEILSGVPGIGKSMLAMQRAAKMGESSPGVIYSLEMSGLSVMRRLVSGETAIRTSALKTGKIRDDEWPVFTQAIDRLSSLPVYLSDCSDWTTAQLRADLARLKAQAGIKWFLVDYLYLLRDGDDRDEIAKTTMISRSLKRICRQLELAGTAVHSMNKAGMEAGGQNQDDGKGRGGPPGNANLRGSGQVIYDADLICFLTGWSDKIKETIRAADKPNMRVLWITKGRELEEANRFIALVQKPGFPRFAEYAPERLGGGA